MDIWCIFFSRNGENHLQWTIHANRLFLAKMRPRKVWLLIFVPYVYWEDLSDKL